MFSRFNVLRLCTLAFAPTCVGIALLAGNPVTPPPEPMVDSFIVQARAAAMADAATWRRQLQAVVADRGGLRVGEALGSAWFRVRTERPLGLTEATRLAARLRADPRVAAAAPDPLEQRSDITPRDGRYGSQWWLQAPAGGNEGVANFTAAWSRSTGVANGAAVAVLDSGITSHPELNSRLLPGYDFVSDLIYANDGDGVDPDPADPGDAVSDEGETGKAVEWVGAIAAADCEVCAEVQAVVGVKADRCWVHSGSG